MMQWTTPSAPLVRPAFVHRFEVSLNTVPLLKIILLWRLQALSEESLAASFEEFCANIGATW